MASINTCRVVIGGLLAGVVMNALDMLWNGVVLVDDMMAISQRLGMDPAAATSFSAAVPWIVVDFVLGLLVVWTYAAMRPRFGAGVRTAVLAGLVLWLATGAVVFGFASMGLMPMSAFVKGALAAILTESLGSIAGAWAYKEA
jgi:hypothetical protein